MNSETKLFLGILLATVGLIVGAAFFFSRPAVVPAVDPKVLVREDSHTQGSPSASVTMVEFGDFECPACSAYHEVVKQITEKYHNEVTLVFRNFPLPMHKHAIISALAAEAAGAQGKYWQMYNKLYESQKDWSGEADPKAKLIGYAKDMGLNSSQFEKDLSNADLRKRIDQDVADGTVLGVNATPTFYINNVKIENPRSFAEFDSLIKAAVDKAPTPSISSGAGYHVHANIKVIVNGKAIDFSQDKYQSKEGKERSEYIHFHDNVGDVIHIHKSGMTLGDLFTSIGMKLTSTCLTDDLKNEYCKKDASPGAFLSMWVNGRENTSFDTYMPNDLDRILISYDSTGDTVRKGSGDALISSYIKSVSDTACIYSEKCPERGKPPSEECVGGLGTECK